MARVQVFEKSPVSQNQLWPKIVLDLAQKKAWDDRRTVMLWTVPSFSDIWYSMMVDKDHDHAWFTTHIPTAATDDKVIYVNPDFFFKLTVDEAVFALTHEIMHAMYGHAGLFYTLGQQGKIVYPDGVVLPVENQFLQYAADYIINDQLIRSNIGAKPKGCLHWPALINGDMGVLEAYRILYEAAESKGGGGRQPKQVPDSLSRSGDGNGNGAGQPFDQVLPPGQGRGEEPNKAQAQRKQVLWDTAIAAAVASAKLKGQLPQCLERLFAQQLEPKACWQDLYSLAVTRKLGNDRYTWNSLDQQLAYRGIGAPGRISYGCELVIVARDSSGSINDETCSVFGAETRGILEAARPKRIIIVDCDAEVHRFEEISDMSELESPAMKKVIGGGGTDFRPVFDRIDKEQLQPDMLIYLTDGYGDFPSAPPPYPTVWGDISHNKELYPFGQVVDIPAQVA